MRTKFFRLYGPFLALALLQSGFVLLAPSRSPQTETAAAFDPSSVDPLPGSASSVEFDDDPGATTASGAGNDSGAGSDGTAPGVDDGGTASQRADGGPGAAGAEVDTSHCIGDRQTDVFVNNPTCLPRFRGDNGGATYRGVTGDTVKIVGMELRANAAASAVLAQQGLAATDDEKQAMFEAAFEVINREFELYGRKVEFVYYASDCPQNPVDEPLCREEARKVARMDPFMVLWFSPIYADVFDEFAREGIISIGGSNFHGSFYNDRRPYRYSDYMDGSQTAALAAEYYCKKLAGKAATNAGVNIHPSIGGRNTPRKPAVVADSSDSSVRTAKELIAQIGRCDPGGPPGLFTFESEIARAQEQSAALTQALIRDGATTVLCVCNNLVPSFLTSNMTTQAYFPEHVLLGSGNLDGENLARLYDQRQWAHAFGLGHQVDRTALPDEQTDRFRVWRAAGNEGEPCNICGLQTRLSLVAGWLLHHAGPQLDPFTVERGALTAESVGGGDAARERVGFGTADYTFASDARETYWDPEATSSDGERGAYIQVDGGRRRSFGEWTADFTVPPAPR